MSTATKVSLKEAIAAVKSLAEGSLDEAHNRSAVVAGINEVMARVEAGEVAESERRRNVMRYLRLAAESI